MCGCGCGWVGVHACVLMFVCLHAYVHGKGHIALSTGYCWVQLSMKQWVLSIQWCREVIEPFELCC